MKYQFEGTIVTDLAELTFDNVEDYNKEVMGLIKEGVEFETFTQSSYVDDSVEVEVDEVDEVEGLTAEDIKFIKELRTNREHLSNSIGDLLKGLLGNGI